jgi:hypothetical protein
MPRLGFAWRGFFFVPRTGVTIHAFSAAAALLFLGDHADRGHCMKRALPLTLAIVLHLPAHATDALPSHLAGVWGTAESLYTGTAAQNFVHLDADGFGFAVGSGAVRRLEGKDDGKPAPRPVIGFPVRATLAGDTLTLRPYLPGQIDETQAARMLISCRYDASAPALTCTGPDGVAMRMRRLADKVDAEVAQQIAAVRAQAARHR